MRPGIHFPVAYFEPPQSAATSSRSQNKRERLFWIYYTIFLLLCNKKLNDTLFLLVNF